MITIIMMVIMMMKGPMESVITPSEGMIKVKRKEKNWWATFILSNLR